MEDVHRAWESCSVKKAASLNELAAMVTEVSLYARKHYNSCCRSFLALLSSGPHETIAVCRWVT